MNVCKARQVYQSLRMYPQVIFRGLLDAKPIGQLTKASSSLFGVDLQIVHYITRYICQGPISNCWPAGQLDRFKVMHERTNLSILVSICDNYHALEVSRTSVTLNRAGPILNRPAHGPHTHIKVFIACTWRPVECLLRCWSLLWFEMSKDNFEEYLARTFPDDDKRSTSGVIHRKLGQKIKDCLLGNGS